VKSSQPAPGYSEVLVAGEPEWRIEEKRLLTGIPIQKAIWEKLLKTAERLGVAVPANKDP